MLAELELQEELDDLAGLTDAEPDDIEYLPPAARPV